jgi:ribosomal protein S18 acetylase RimI-like enzyme
VDQDVLVVETATSEDVALAQVLIDGAREWLRSRGIDQWQDAVPDSVLVRDAERGNLFFVRRRSEVAAMVTVYDSDAEVWGDDMEPALYVHRLAVGQAHRGAQLGERLLRWVEEQALRHELRAVRLDCATDNPGLRRFYEQLGFQHLRDVTVLAPDGGRTLTSSLYERPLVR